MNQSKTEWRESLLSISRSASKLNSLWLTWTYPFASIGKGVSIHYTSELYRDSARYMKIGNRVIIAKHAWLYVTDLPNRKEPAIILEDGCGVQRRCTIAARNQVHIGRKTVFGPGALVTDHAFAFAEATHFDPGPSVCRGGRIRIEEGCWIGYGAAIVCEEGELIIGRHSIVGANSVVTRNIPPYSIVSGNPGLVVKHYDPTSTKWMLGSREAYASSIRSNSLA